MDQVPHAKNCPIKFFSGWIADPVSLASVLTVIIRTMTKPKCHKPKKCQPHLHELSH